MNPQELSQEGVQETRAVAQELCAGDGPEEGGRAGPGRRAGMSQRVSKRAHRHVEEACTPRLDGDRRPLGPPSKQEEQG